jgi:hypothetical protein
MTNEDMKHGISTNVASKMLGLLQSAQQEWVGGLLRRIEYILVAETFDNFLDHAAVYHKGNKKIEASVLASAVLGEDKKRGQATLMALLAEQIVFKSSLSPLT